MKFLDYGLSEPVIQGIINMGFEEPTEIQAQSIPVAKTGRDLIAQSQTGTGKTASFTIPVLENIDPDDRSLQALVLCPTRELAVQMSEAIAKLASGFKGLNVVPVYGGENIGVQIRKIRRGAQIVVGTPGRTRDHLNRGTLRADDVKTLVLDEADEMLKMGFKEELESILEYLPEDRQTLLFSATMPATVRHLAKQYTNDPERIKIEAKGITNEDIDQKAYLVRWKNKVEALNRLIISENPQQCLVFCNTKRAVDELTDELQQLKLTCEKIHGDIPQHLRLDAINRFNRGTIRVLIATDVAARGLDIVGVDAVYNYEVPGHPEVYVHRIGRTGRAGRKGLSSTLISRREVDDFEAVQRYIKMNIEFSKLPTLSDLNQAKLNRFEGDLVALCKEEAEQRALEMIDRLVEKGYDVKEVAAHLVAMQLDLDDRSESDLSFHLHRRQTRTTSAVKVNVGRKHGVEVRSILGFFHSKSGIRKDQIGDIKLRNEETILCMNEETAKKAIKALNNRTWGDNKLHLEFITYTDDRERNRGGRGGNFKRGRGNGGRGNGGRGGYNRGDRGGRGGKYGGDRKNHGRRDNHHRDK